MKKIIGIHEPTFQGNEKQYVLNCIKDGWVSTSGKFLNLFTKKLQKITNELSQALFKINLYQDTDMLSSAHYQYPAP